MPVKWAGRLSRVNLLRKMPVDFSEFLGPKPCFTKVGIYDDVKLLMVEKAEIVDAMFRATLDEDYCDGIMNARINGWAVDGDVAIELVIRTDSGKELFRERKPVQLDANGRWDSLGRI